MKQLYIIPLIALFFIACTEESKVDADKLLVSSCAKCHNLSQPPVIPEIELAPPMMAVTFHLKGFIKALNPSEHKHKFSTFVSDYIRFPSKDKSYCDEASMKMYGLMPSLKNELTQNEAYQIAQFIYDKYDAKKFYKDIKAKSDFEEKPKGEQLVIKKGCLSCHSILKTKIAPSFTSISKHSTKKTIQFTLLNGSKGIYAGFEKYKMPALGKTMSKKDLNIIVNWISNL